VLLAKTLRSSTFRLALVCIALFGAVVFALFGYVYWSTASYVRNRSDQAISAEFAIMQKAYANAGRSGLITTIAQRLASASTVAFTFSPTLRYLRSLATSQTGHRL
jgi:hypothetical protein